MTIKVTLEITSLEQLEMTPPVPVQVQVRIKLNEAGFKFEDDGRLSIINNLSPRPLGTFKQWLETKTGSIHYSQEY